MYQVYAITSIKRPLSSLRGAKFRVTEEIIISQGRDTKQNLFNNSCPGTKTNLNKQASFKMTLSKTYMTVFFSFCNSIGHSLTIWSFITMMEQTFYYDYWDTNSWVEAREELFLGLCHFMSLWYFCTEYEELYAREISICLITIKSRP